MTDAKSQAAANGKRRWFQSIAGKLLTAFGLIAALTVGASWLSLIRFNQIDSAMRRMTEVSLPLVKLSADVESKTSELTSSASELAESETDVQQFERMTLLTEQVGQLWSVLGQLQTIIVDQTMTAQLQAIVASLDTEIGAIDRATRDLVQTATLRNRAIEQSSWAHESALRPIGALADQISARINSAGATEPDQLRSNVALSQTLQAIRADIDRIADLQTRIVGAQGDGLADLTTQLTAVQTHLQQSIATQENDARLDSDRRAELSVATGALLSSGTGAQGLPALQTQYVAQRQAVVGSQRSLQAVSANLRTKVAALMQDADRETTNTAQMSVQAIDSSRIWLILIAIASLVLAALIVWLFVLRYVAARLTELADSMLAIARGELETPIPAAKADELGDMSRTLAVFRDNSRGIRAAKEEAEAASRTKSAFLANMSHELRTPLNAIIGYSEILVEDAGDRGDDTTVGDLQKIQGAGKHLLGLINGILDLSKIEAGRMDIYLEQVHLAKLLEEVRTIVEPLVKKNGSKLVTECPPDIGSMRTDLTKLKQNLINLLSNAAKFTKDGTVSLSVSRENPADGPSRFSFRISDTGIGMSEEQLGRLFQAFSQADTSTTRNYGGTGLGLTITRHFATMLGGTIEVTSKAGEGSTFTMVLPDQPATVSAMPAEIISESQPAQGGVGLTVLVVDDDPAVHDLLSATLVREGYRVLHARDGAEALEILRKTPPDIVTLDVMMPKIDGWSVLGTMKSDPMLDNIPVIMITIVDDRNLGYTLGASEFMTKPIDRARLVALVRSFTGQKSQSLVLIVDDDADVREMVRATLESSGLKTAQAPNGRAAVDWLNSNPVPSLILLDLMMPEMDGFGFLEEIRSDDELVDVPVVVLTAKELTEQERAFLAERTILVLSKSAQPIGRLGSALSVIAKQRKIRTALPSPAVAQV